MHLAAFDPGVRVLGIWLLDIYLLMEALEDGEIVVLLERAGKARALEACLVFGEMAAGLGADGDLERVLGALRSVASERRMRGYDRTLRWRGWDLGCYWGRLGVGDKLGFFGDLFRWVRVR